MWSNEILAELRTNLAELNPPPDVDRLVANMSKHFPESLITGHAHLIPKMGCHPKDAHVLAAAVQARATQAARFTKPRLTTLELLEQLKHPQRLPEFALEACRWVAQRGW